MQILRLWLSLVIGFFLGLSNLYLGLKIGFTVGTAVLTIFCWAGIDWLFRHLSRRWRALDSGEYVCYQSLSSAMSFGSGTVIATSLSALLMDGGPTPPAWALAAWTASVCGLGCCLALTFRSRMLAQLPFPSGQVAAETVEKVGMGHDLKPFFATLGLVWLWVAVRDFFRWVPARLPGATPVVYAQLSPMLLGLGALLGLRITGSLLLGGCVFFLGVPLFAGDLEEAADRSLWFAMGMIVAASVLEFLVTLVRSRRLDRATEPERRVPGQVPLTLLCASATALLMGFGFTGTSWTLVLTLALMWPWAMVSCRACGETDVTPTGSLGKLSLMVMGLARPGQMAANMSATGALTANSAAATDCMNNLKTGSLLGVPVARQFYYQFAGALAGAFLFVPLFLLLAEGGAALGGKVFPAPAAEIWLNVARATGSGSLPIDPGHQAALGLGALMGAAWFGLTRWKPVAAWLPSPVPFAMAVVLDWSTVFTLFLGALIGRWVSPEKGFKIWCAMIAAESAGGVLLALAG